MDKIAAMIILGLAALVIGALLSFVYAIPVWLLWNWLAPMFTLPILGYLKAWGLTYLSSCLFKPQSTGK